MSVRFVKQGCFAAAMLALLSACGADGAPVPPKPKAKPGVVVSGEARVGVVYVQ